MTAKVLFVLGFCVTIGILFVSPSHWWDVFSGFARFGNVPVADGKGGETVTNLFWHYREHGVWPLISLANIAVLGGFAGYAGGGGLGNSTYSNYVRDKGWGMGLLVGAIPSAVGGRRVALSHLGTVFPLTEDNLQRWRGWWRYILTDQLLIWGPGCFMGMALPALLSIQFSQHSPLYHDTQGLDWAQAIISADGLRNAPGFTPVMAHVLWIMTLLVGMTVLLPSQMSIVDDFSRRWTDILWSGSGLIRGRMQPHQVSRIYYTILTFYVGWSIFCMWLFSTYGSPKLMVLVIANLNNVAIGWTSFHLVWVNRRLLPAPLRPRWFQQLGVVLCGVFYLGLAGLVFVTKQLPGLRDYFGI
jgi:hypothetical protein